MNEPMHFDLVAIGGGFAGLCAAVRGAELGLRTAVLEAGADEGYLCSSRWAGGIFHVSYHDVKLSPDELAGRDQPSDRRRSGSGIGGGDCRRCGPHRRLAREPGRRLQPREPDRLASFYLGAAARGSGRAGLAGARPGPAARRIAPAARGTPGPAAARRPGGSTAPGAGPGRRRHRTPARRGARYRRRCGGDRRWRVSRQCRAVPQLYRAATRPGADAPCRQRDRRRPEDGRRGGGGADWARPLLRPSVEPRRDGEYRVVALSADRCGRDRGHRGGSARRPDPRRGAGRHFDRQ